MLTTLAISCAIILLNRFKITLHAYLPDKLAAFYLHLTFVVSLLQEHDVVFFSSILYVISYIIYSYIWVLNRFILCIHIYLSSRFVLFVQIEFSFVQFFFSSKLLKVNSIYIKFTFDKRIDLFVVETKKRAKHLIIL